MVEEIAEVPGIGRRTAEAIAGALRVDPARQQTGSVTINTATGEILDADPETGGAPMGEADE